MRQGKQPRLSWAKHAVAVVAILAASSGAVARQDVVDLAEGEVDAAARWRAHLVAVAPVRDAVSSLDSFDAHLPSIGISADRPFVLSDALPEPRGRQAVQLYRVAASDDDSEPRLDTLTGLGAYAEPSPEVAAAGETRPAAEIHATRDGSTPALMMASVTTPMTEEAPLEIGALPVTQLRLEIPEDLKLGEGGQVSEKDYARQHKCLSEAVYFEARGEPEVGQYAVAQVVMNRVRSVYYPNTICGVVYENRHLRNRCQFSFACDGIADRVGDQASWARAERVATAVLKEGYYLADVGTSTHYHADYVRPRWIRDMVKEQKLGRHIFYRVRNWSEEGV